MIFLTHIWKGMVITMHIDTNDLLQSILASFDRIDYVKSQDIPNIDLYMDQVTTFMDKNLRKSSRYPENDKVMTKTMINNYAKNDLLPPPIKKKYSKEHVLVLISIYYYKGIFRRCCSQLRCSSSRQRENLILHLCMMKYLDWRKNR